MPVALGTLAVTERVDNPLTRADKDALAGLREWENDPRRISVNRLFTVDLPKGVKTYARGFTKDERETLRLDALVWIAGHESIGSVNPIDIGPVGALPLKRVWLDENRRLTPSARTVMQWAIRAAKETSLSRMKREARELPTEAGPLGLLAEREELDADLDSGLGGFISALPSDLARVMGMSEDCARWIDCQLSNLSGAEMAEQWGITRQSAINAVSRGRKLLSKRFPCEEMGKDGKPVPDPYELVQSLRAASSALLAIREDAARQSLIDYKRAPTDAWALSQAREDSRAYMEYARQLSPGRRALVGALTRALAPNGPQSEADSEALADKVTRYADSMTRLLLAERTRELDNMRKGRRGILAGHFSPGTDKPLYIGEQRRGDTEDAEVRANSERVARYRAERESGDYFPARAPTETDRQRWHDARRALAIAQALDASESAAFNPQPSRWGREWLMADARTRAELDKRMADARKARAETRLERLGK